MFRSTWGQRRGVGGVVALVALASVLLLNGCAAPTLSARVTAFQQWPQNVQGQTYQFVPEDAAQANNLEYRSYQDIVRAGMGNTGLVEARAGANPRFDVSFRYETTMVQYTVRRPYDPFLYGPSVYGARPLFGSLGFWGGPPEWVDVPLLAYRNVLTLYIRDKQKSGAEVYRSSVTIQSNVSNDLLRIMPYLVRALFTDFPRNNGTDQDIQLPFQSS